MTTTFDVLDPKTKIFSQYFLEASAGTGKTFAIENIVPRLLLESENPPLQLAEILVVTFTRAATRELKFRIYQNLLKIKTALDTKEGGPPYIAHVLKGDEAAVSQAKRRIEEALCFFETAQVFTLHGFCLKILQEFAFEAQFFLSSQDEEECAQKEKLKEYIKDFLRRGINPETISRSQLQRVIQDTGREIEALCDALFKRLEGGQKIRPYPTALERFHAWNEAFASLPSVSKEDLWHDFSLVAPALARSRKRKDQADLFFTWIEKKGCSFQEWDDLVGQKEFFLEELKFSAAYKKKTPQQLGLNHPGLFEEMQRVFTPLYTAATDAGVALLSLAAACRPHYEKGREDLSHFNPDDLVTKLQEALLQDSSFSRKVQERYKAIIIDEFQDTDPTQWNIFETLFFKNEEKPQVLYLVGDPKQSIYAFRRADVYLYLRAASLLGDQALAYLDTNFRSHPHLVDALNEFFSFNLPARWMLLPLLGKSLEVRRVVSKPWYPSALEGDEKGRLHFFLVEDEGGYRKKWPREEIEETKLFPWMAQEIHSLQKKGYSLQQIAILVKDRYQAMRLQTFFKQWNIPCLMQKNLDVPTSVAYEVMKDLLLAVERPSSLSALKKFLGGSLLGFSSREIEGSLENPNLQRAKEMLLEAGSTFRTKGFGVFFQNVLLSPSSSREATIGEDLLSREDSHLYFDLRQLCQILLENCPEGLYDPGICLEFLKELRDLPLTSETLRQCAEEEEDQVQVMTLHKSKGLEFEIVFALGICSRHVQGDEFISVREKDGREMAASSQEADSLLLHLQEIDAEKLRQLYVALTRAKERVYVPLVLSSSPHEIPKGAAAPIELLVGAVGLTEYVLEDVYQSLFSFSLQQCVEYLSVLQKRAPISYEVVKSCLKFEKTEKENTQPLIAPPVFSIRAPDLFLLSFSSLIEGKKEGAEKIYLEPPQEGDLPLGSETGTVIHSILEELCKADLHKAQGPSAQKIIKRCSKGSCLEGKEEALSHLVQEAMLIPLGEEIASLGEIPSFDMQTEMEFLYPFRSSFLKGFIDLVFRYKGRYYLLDWKTNYLGPSKEDYSIQKIEQCMEQSGYFLQASIYRMALKKYLALFEKEPFDSLFGGAIYFFLRGNKPYFFQPDLKDLGDFPCSSK